MMQINHVWAVVLAAGDGKRLSSLTMDKQGRHVPKQFCAVNGGLSLLGIALERAQALVPQDRICVVVAKSHEHWWQPMAPKFQPGNLIVQPQNRGTGNGVLLALSSILKRDPQARFIFLPSDHHVLNEVVLNQAMLFALSSLKDKSRDILLLGIEPDDADPDLGYVIPQETSRHDVQGVRRFVEKPSRGVAGKLIQEGGLWNSGIFAANGAALMALFKQRFPGNAFSIAAAIAKMGDPISPSWSLGHLYERIAEVDFSHHILQLCVNDLRVVRVPHCGWSDLGTPDRVTERVNMLPAVPGRTKGRHSESALPSLSDAVYQAGRRCVSAVIH